MLKDKPAALALCVILAGCGQSSGAAAACAPDGANLVVNTGAGLWQAEQIEPQLTEIWRIGESESEPRFGYPAAMAASRSGQLAVADFDRDQVLVFAADGQWLGAWPDGHTVGKPVAVVWDPDERLHIFDLGGSALLITDADGRLVHEQPISDEFLNSAMQEGGLDWAGVLPDGTVIFQPLPPLDPEAADPGQSTWTLLRQRPGAADIDTLARIPARLFGYTTHARTPVPSWPRLRSAAGGTGLLAIGGTQDGYRIQIYRPDGELIRTLCRDAAPLPLSSQEQGEISNESGARLLREAPTPPEPASFGHLFWSADDHLWVQRERPFTLSEDPYVVVHGESGGRYDILDAQGRYLGVVQAPTGVWLRAAAGTRVWGLATSETGAPEIVAYELHTH